MLEAVGTYSNQIKGLLIRISAAKTVEIRLLEQGDLKDDVTYQVTAELNVKYRKGSDPEFTARILTAVPVQNTKHYALYKGVFRINEEAGSITEKHGSELVFYRGDAFSDDLSQVDLEKATGWVTVAVPKTISGYPYKPGDLLYVDGKIFHKNRVVEDIKLYEICVRAERCHKVDGTEFWERVRCARHNVFKRS